MSEQDYEKLLRKYKHQHPLEKRSKEYERRKKQEQRRKAYLETAEVFMGPDNLNMKGDQRQHAFWIIQHVPLKQLHQHLNYENIILAVCWYVKKLFNSRAKFNEYRVFREYGLTLEQAYLILTRITSYAFNRSYLVPVQTSKYEHETLQENGGIV